MRWSKTLLPTLKEDPADAEIISHKLLVRAGFIRQISRGIYDYFPLALKVIRKIEQIVRQEMDRAGAQELLMPICSPAELWQESGRWEMYGKELLRFKDRHERDFCLGPTHEEIITDLVRRSVRSYRELPFNLYQIQTKFRDEVRPRFGLMRGREFIMKDAYSFHADMEDCRREYDNMYETYKRIFTRCGLSFRPVEADTGAIGGSVSHEFQVLAESGEDAIVSCNSCDYAANIEKAEVKARRPDGRNIAEDPPPLWHRTIWISDIHLGTPGCKAEFLLDFLKWNDSDTLYLVGDIIDLWAMKRKWYWPQTHNDVIRKILKRASKGTHVTYIPGNHDDFFRNFTLRLSPEGAEEDTIVPAGRIKPRGKATARAGEVAPEPAPTLSDTTVMVFAAVALIVVLLGLILFLR